MGTIPVEKVERGDILLVTERPKDPLARLIIDLDQSPRRFSHAGVAGGKSVIVSSYPWWEAGDPLDLGGVHHNDFSHFWASDQEIYRLQLPRGVSRSDAARRLDDYPEDREGAFGWAKCVMVAATLHVLASQDRIGTKATAELLYRAADAAEWWYSEDDFFCAEFVAHIYGLAPTVGDLRPPAPLRRDLLTSGDISIWEEAFLDIAQWVLTRAATDEQRARLTTLVGALKRYDPQFFTLGLSRLGEMAERYSPISYAVKPTVRDDQVLPPALMTPRVLEMWGRGVDRIERTPGWDA